MHAFRVVIAVIEGPVGLTHRSHNVSSFDSLITGFHFSQNVYSVKVLLRTDLSPELLIWKQELSSIVGTGYSFFCGAISLTCGGIH